jgi:hypothetical protein
MTDGVHIGHQTVGDGPLDIVAAPFGYANIEVGWEVPAFVSFVRRLSSLGSRVAVRPPRHGNIGPRFLRCDPEHRGSYRGHDIRAVTDVTGSERAVLFGAGSGGALLRLRRDVPGAGDEPGRLQRFGAGFVGAGSPWAWTEPEYESWLVRLEEKWGSPAFARVSLSPFVLARLRRGLPVREAPPS